MKQILLIIAVLTATFCAAQDKPGRLGLTPYIGGGFSTPKGQYFEGGISTTKAKKNTAGGFRIGVAYHQTRYVTGVIDTIPLAVKYSPGIDAWKVSTIQFTAMIDLFPKTSGQVNVSFAPGVAVNSSTVTAYNHQKQVGDKIKLRAIVYPKMSFGIGYSGILATLDVLIPIDYPMDYAPVNVGVILYPAIMFPKKASSTKKQADLQN